MLRRFWARLLIIFAAASVMAVPAMAQNTGCKRGNTGQIIGGVGGAIAGGLLGRAIDGGNHRAVGTILGAVVGGLAGSAIGKQLDKCERERIDTATMAAVNDRRSGTSSAQAWQSDSRDVHGTVTASAPTNLSDGRQCRTVTRVAYINGQEVREQPRLCRRPPESEWVAA